MATLDSTYVNSYNPGKNFYEVFLRSGRRVYASEINEMQSMIGARIARLGSASFRDGDIISGCGLSLNSATGAVSVGGGEVFINGHIWDVPGRSFYVSQTGLVYVGVWLEETVITASEDTSLAKTDGARRKITLQWGHSGENLSGNFYTVYTVNDGALKVKAESGSAETFMTALAEYDRDSTGNGTYVVDGLSLAKSADENGKQVYYLASGRARVNGESVKLTAARRIEYAATPELREFGTEITRATSANMAVKVAHPPMQGNPDYVRIVAETTLTVLHGASMGCQDELSVSGIVEIREVKQGSSAYAAGTDYRKSGDMIDWSPAGAEPAAGSTYTAKVWYLKTVAPTNVTLDGFSVSGAVTGQDIIYGYRQMLPRYDRLVMDATGQTSWIKGVANSTNPVAPVPPADSLLLATVLQNWRQTRQVINDSSRVVPFASISALQERVEYALQEISRNRLAVDASVREAGGKVGMFVDPLLDDSMRDAGIAQKAVVIDGSLLLDVENLQINYMPSDVRIPTARPYSDKIYLSQTARTGAMKVNAYQAITPVIMPAKITLVPATDQWTTYDAANVSYLRSISVSYSVTGFAPGEKVKAATLGGVNILSLLSNITADASGNLSGKFTIPDKKIASGTQKLEFVGMGGTTGSANFSGIGRLLYQPSYSSYSDAAASAQLGVAQKIGATAFKVTLDGYTSAGDPYYTVSYTTSSGGKSVTQGLSAKALYANYGLTCPNRDPLAQTFTPERHMMLTGIDLWFTKKGSKAITVQLRTTENGFPAKEILAEKVLAPSAITLNNWTRVNFGIAVSLSANTEYAFVVIADEDTTELSIAQLGKFDANSQKWLTRQSYIAGVMFSSSNASSWTIHQDSDLTFRLIEAAFSGTTPLTVNLGNVSVSNATDLVLYGIEEIPTSACYVDYTLTLPNGTKLTVVDNQPVNLSSAVTGAINVTANIYGDTNSSAVLYPGTQLAAATRSTTGDYVSRSVPASGATKATLIYEVLAPSGSSVQALLQIDGGAWQEMTQTQAINGDNGLIEITKTKTLSNNNQIKLKFVLTGTAAARPEIYNVRLMATA